MQAERYYLSLDNIIDDLSGFRAEGISYTVSGRRLPKQMDAVDAVRLFYHYVDPDQIVSVYGALTEPSPLYGGWLTETGRNSAVTHEQAARLQESGVGFALALSNHRFSEDAYETSRALLDAYHRPGNGVICVSDDLARRIKRDYPNYTLEASSIKNLNTDAKIQRALELYDYVVLPSEYNKSDRFLQGLSRKDRIILFGNSICAHGCPTRECYRKVSARFHEQRGLGDQVCFKWIWSPNVTFDVRKFHGMGFSLFKLVPICYPQTEELLSEYEKKHGIRT